MIRLGPPRRFMPVKGYLHPKLPNHWHFDEITEERPRMEAGIQIPDKRTMYDLLKRGVLGNAVRHWASLEAMLADPYSGEVGLRSTEIGDPWGLYHTSKAAIVEALAARGHDGRNLEFYESPPDDCRRIQGELMRGPGGHHFRYTFAPGAMRLALRESELHAAGLEADLLLRQHCDPGCYDWLMELLDTYDGAVVEFTSYSIPVGMLEQPWLIWEVRHY
jgi:hypothetical protein